MAPPELPNDLLTYIFGHLQPAHISACRLASRPFHYLASPYLIPRVVLAKRIDTIAKLKEVAEHPYFSKHVAELVYEGSLYEAAPQTLHDAEWARLVREDAEALELLNQLDDPQDLAHEQSTQRSLLEQWEEVRPDDSDREEEEREVMAAKMGWHRSFPSYRHRYHVHESLSEFHMLSYLTAKLPKLQSIVVSDYRDLSRNDEGFDQTCRRLFGNVLPPTPMTHESFQDDYFEGVFRFLECFANHLHVVKLTALTLHESEYESGVDSCYCDLSYLLEVFSDKWLDSMGERLAALHRFELAFEFDRAVTQRRDEGTGHFESLTFALTPLQSFFKATPALSCLRLSVRDVTSHAAPENGGHYALEWAPWVFNLLLASMCSIKLSHLDLRGFVFLDDDMRELLAHHAHTLRELRLVNNILIGNSEELATWGGAQLCLKGVEIKNWLDMSLKQLGAPCKAENRLCTSSDDELETLWLDGRANQMWHERPVQVVKPQRKVGKRDQWWLQPRQR